MKSYLWLTIITISLVVGGAFFVKLEMNDRHIDAQTTQQIATFEIELQDVQPMFSEEMNEIGMLQPHTALAVIDENETHYTIPFGQAVLLVEKKEGIIKKGVSRQYKQLPITDIVKGVNKATVYAQPTTDSEKIAELHAGYRYPVVETGENWHKVQLGGQTGYIAKQNTQVDEGIPVLVYHHILPKQYMTTTASTVSQESFSEHMRYLHSAQFTTITTKQLAKYLQGEMILPIETVLITFDDGLLSTKEYAYPILKDYGFTAVQHLISSRIVSQENPRDFDASGPLQFFTKQEMFELSDVFHYEAHTHNLHRLKDGQGVALRLYATQIEQDLKQNVSHLGHVTSIAYPFGHYNEAFIEAVKQAGIQLGFTTNVGYANIKASPYEIGRLGMTEKTTFAQFTSYVKGELVEQ